MAQFKVYRNNRLINTIPGVLAPVALAAVATTSGSNVITVTSTTGVYPGMAIACPNVPVGSFVASVISTTTIELAGSVFNRTTGVWSTSAANANASATVLAAVGQTALAFGYHPFCIVEQSYPLGTWRNEIRNSSVIIPTSMNSVGGATILLSGAATMQVPALLTSATVTQTVDATVNPLTNVVTPVYDVKDDTCAATPLKRHNGEPWGVRILVSTGGLISHVSGHPDWTVQYAGADA